MLAHFVPGFVRGDFVEVIKNSDWSEWLGRTNETCTMTPDDDHVEAARGEAPVVTNLAAVPPGRDEMVERALDRRQAAARLKGPAV